MCAVRGWAPRRFNGGVRSRWCLETNILPAALTGEDCTAALSRASGRLAALTGVVGAIGNVATSSCKRKDKQPPRRLNGGGWASEHSGG